jgi:hypothetical protein
MFWETRLGDVKRDLKTEIDSMKKDLDRFKMASAIAGAVILILSAWVGVQHYYLIPKWITDHQKSKVISASNDHAQKALEETLEQLRLAKIAQEDLKLALLEGTGDGDAIETYNLLEQSIVKDETTPPLMGFGNWGGLLFINGWREDSGGHHFTDIVAIHNRNGSQFDTPHFIQSLHYGRGFPDYTLKFESPDSLRLKFADSADGLWRFRILKIGRPVQ